MEDLQGLLEKINRDGVAKAEAEAKAIIDEAKAKAAALVKEANEQASKAKAEAEKSAGESAARAAETIRQAARDTVLSVQSSVNDLLAAILTKNVEKALADEATVSALVAEAVKSLVGPGEITCGEKLANALRAQLAQQGAFTVVTDATMGTGFAVKVEGGRVESAFTPDVIAAELAKRLRPDLAKLMK